MRLSGICVYKHEATAAADEETNVPDAAEDVTDSDETADQTADTGANEKDGFLGWLSSAIKSIAARFGF